MATTTTNQGFTKPEGSDGADISVLNGNWDLADAMVTLTGNQTLTNKTLTSPHLTTATVDSGGLTVTAGGATITAGGLTVTAGGAGIGGGPSVTAGLSVSDGAATDATNRYGALLTQQTGGSADNASLYAQGTCFLGTVSGTTATDGFLYIPYVAGAPTGTPYAPAGHNHVPIVYDVTNEKLMLYHGGWKGVALA